MSDEGLMNLEDDDGAQATTQEGTEQVQEAAQEAQEAAGQTPAQDEGQPAEVEAVEVGGSKYVPLKVVIQERKERQAATRQVQEATQQLQQLQQQYAQIAPYAEILRQNPELLRPRQAEPARPAADAAPDPDLVELAQTLDLYDPTTGQPDAKKAAKIAGIFDKRNEGKVQQAVQPYQQQTLSQQVQANYATALQIKGANGESVNKQVFDDLFTQAARERGGLQTLADPRAAMIIALASMGAQAVTAQPRVQPPANAPLVTEPSGGSPRGRPFMSRLEEKITKDKGVDAQTWAKHTQGFQKGAANALED